MLFRSPAIILYCSSVEALVNERFSLKEKSAPENCKSLITIIRDGLDDNRSLSYKIKNAHQILSEGCTAKLGDATLQNFVALIDVRNAFIHYNPDFGDVFEWPKRLENALKRSRVKQIVGNWDYTFRTMPFVTWAYNTTSEMIKCFLFEKDEVERFFRI